MNIFNILESINVQFQVSQPANYNCRYDLIPDGSCMQFHSRNKKCLSLLASSSIGEKLYRSAINDDGRSDSTNIHFKDTSLVNSTSYDLQL